MHPSASECLRRHPFGEALGLGAERIEVAQPETWLFPARDPLLVEKHRPKKESKTDPHHDISIICLHAMVRSILPWL